MPRSRSFSASKSAVIVAPKSTDDWHSIVLAAGKELILEIPFIPLFIILCLTWRLPFVWNRLHQNPKHFKKIIATEYLLILVDIIWFSFSIPFLLLTLHLLPNTLYKLVQLDYSDLDPGTEWGPKFGDIVWTNVKKAWAPIKSLWQHFKTWLDNCFPQPEVQATLQPYDPTIFWLIQKVFRWRAAELNRDLNKLRDQGLHFNRYYTDQIAARYLQYLWWDFGLVFRLLTIFTIGFWRIPSFIYHMKYGVFPPVAGWSTIHHVTYLQSEQVLPDILHVPLLAVLCIFFWRIPQFVAKVWSCPYTNVSGPTQTLRNYIKLGMLDLICALIIALIIVTMYRLPSLIASFRTKEPEKSWQEVVFQEFVPETEIEFLRKLERKWEEEDNNNNNNSRSSTSTILNAPTGRKQTRTPSPARGRKSPARRRPTTEEEEPEERPARRSPARGRKSPSRKSESPSRKSPARRRPTTEEEEPVRRSTRSKSPARKRNAK